MPISDNNPERRNLVVTAIAFILYFIGGGEIESGTLSIQAINIKFENTTILITCFWIILFWFYLRYIQNHKTEYRTALQREVQSEHCNPILITFLERRLNKKHKCENGFVVMGLNAQKGDWHVVTCNIDGGKKGEDGKWAEYKTTNSEKNNLNWAWFGFIRLSLFFMTAIKKPGVGSWLVPKLLFYTACFLGLLNFVKVLTN